MKRHVRNYHLQQTHTCTICNRVLNKSTDMKGHIQKMHTKKSDTDQCNICMKTFANVSNLRSHYKTVHQGEKEFKCNQCEKAYTSRQNLKKHLNLLHKNLEPLNVQYDTYTSNLPILKKRLFRFGTL